MNVLYHRVRKKKRITKNEKKMNKKKRKKLQHNKRRPLVKTPRTYNGWKGTHHRTFHCDLKTKA